MNDVVIRGAAGILTGLSGSDERATGDIRIGEGRIKAVGTVVPEPGDQVIDASGSVVYPGLVSTHHHLFQSVLKGIPAGIDLPLEGWLRTVPFSYWHKLDEDALEVAATVGLAELLLSGTTTIADHHYLFTENYGFDPAATIFRVAERLGIRLVLCRGGATQGRDFDIPHTQPMPKENLDGMIRRVGDLAARFNDPSPESMRRVVFAPTTLPWSVLPEELDVIAEAARAMKLRLHSHLSETHVYVDFCMEKYGKRPVQWAGDHGWLGKDVWFAHLVHLDESELRLLAETGTGMAHCPQSNCRLGSGVAAADRLTRLGGPVSLAVDGAASNEACDMISEMHCAWLVHRAAKGAQAVRAEDVLHWATAGGARVLDMPTIGTIEVGKTADLAIFDLSRPRYAGLHDPLIGPIVAGGDAQLRHLLVGGRTVVENGAIPGLDLAALSHRTAGIVRRLAA
ncbi:amidohydrolase family protein [Telmatospirillum siberiense]|uniref:Amidohydrolase n=1 Tax=Telmatospirillum siberiense TaxID=382514 RepID=A0A2N3PVR4_9PROT|nr:amidohydrolase family protein [Telmatospirillum siberiense]PKU24478.1 amidohydrolase [Telmatospirillum siberiense]